MYIESNSVLAGENEWENYERKCRQENMREVNTVKAHDTLL